MTDRVLSALRGLGIQVSPLATLEREDGFFALLPDLLVYQDEQGTRRVTLRDLTRIHSDAEGLLRVETPAGTALTANLLGFEPGEVQGFFARVRDATAQAKNLPAAPLPTPGGFKTFGSPPRTTTPPQGKATQPTEPPRTEAPRQTREPEASPTPAPEVQGTPDLPGPPPPSPQPTRAVQPKATPKFGQSRQAQGKPGQSRETQGRAAQPEPVQTTKSGVTVVSADPGASPAPAPVTVAPVVAPPAPPSAQESPPPVPASPAAASPAPVAADSGGLGELGARAAAVRGLPSRLQVLAVVLGLAAIGLAYFQYRDGAPLGGLWTLIAGGVGSVALFVFAEVTRLIVVLAGAVARSEGPGASEVPGD